jgi:hypothetical protein
VVDVRASRIRPFPFWKGRQSEVPELTNAELVQLRTRVIALENLVIALLADDLIGSLTLLAKWQPTSLQGQASPIIL